MSIPIKSEMGTPMTGTLWKDVGVEVCPGRCDQTPLPEAINLETTAQMATSKGHIIGVPEAGITLNAYSHVTIKDEKIKVILHQKSWSMVRDSPPPVCINWLILDVGLIGLTISFPFETQKKMLAVAMACHARLGASSPLRDVVGHVDMRPLLHLHDVLCKFEVERLEWPIRFVKSEVLFVEVNESVY